MLWLLISKGGGDVQQPLDSIIYGDKIDSENKASFQFIEEESELNELILQTSSRDKLLILKFYAEWCIACKKLERVVFTDTRVNESMEGALAYTVDVTKNSIFNQSALSRFSLVGPPAILFIKDGKEIKSQRIVGEVSAKELTKRLNSFKLGIF